MGRGVVAASRKPRSKASFRLFTASLLLSAVGIARADMIATQQLVDAAPRIYKDSIPALLGRSGIENQLRSLGVGRKYAHERVAALTDEEVQAVAGRLDSLYAGGQYVSPVVPGMAGAGGGYGGGAGYGAAGGNVVILALGLLAVLNWGQAQGNASTQYTTNDPAPMDPNRKINEQDCTKPIVYDRGNLRCK